MHRLFVRCSGIAASFVFALNGFAGFAHAQTAAAVQRSARVIGAIDANQTVRLSGHVPDFADPSRLPATAISPSERFEHLTVVLSRAPAVEAAFEQLLADQVNPQSSRYHQWLTPAQVGALYGPAQSDVDAVTSWLQGRGLSVDEISPNRLFVRFSGTVSAVENAFATSFSEFSLANGEHRYSLTREPSVPAAIQPVIANIVGLSQVIHYSTAHKGELVAPKTGSSASSTGGLAPALNSSSGNHYMVAGDFAVAYDINPVYTAGITGTGQNIAIAGKSRVASVDITALQTIQGMAAKLPNVIVPPSGKDPGAAATASGSADNGDQDEATLDVNRISGTSYGANIDQVVSADVGSGSTATDGLDIAIAYAVNTVNDPILSISYGGCEYLNGAASSNYYASVFQTAAAQGMTTFVSSGDDGAAACNAFYNNIPNPQQLSINDLCASQYVTCVGGTEFADSTNASTYWSATNGTNFVSLLSYIPEGAWNDVSTSSTGVYTQGATGGGTSVYLARPSWQTGTGVFAGSFRLIPDVSFSSSGHDGYVTCLAYQGATCGSFYSFGGTSAAAPSMAGIQALVNQKLSSRQGNINPGLYSLASSSPTAFHDVTVASSGVSSCAVTTPSLCNNSTPTSTTLTGGLSGYLVTAGWDASTGWGSLDVAKYMAAVAAVPSFTITPATSALTISPGASATDTLTIAATNAFAGTVALSCTLYSTSGSSVGSCSATPSTVVLAGASAASTLTIAVPSATTGVYKAVVTGTSGSNTVYATIVVTGATSTTPTFTLTPSSASLSFLSGATAGNSVTYSLTSLNGFAGTVNLSCNITTSSAAFPPSCNIAPSSVVLASGSISTPLLTIGSTTAITAALDPHTSPLGWRLGGGATLALLLFCVPVRRRKRFASLTLAALMAVAFLTVTGCSDKSTPALTTTTRSSAGTYTVTVTATGTSSGATSAVAQTATVAVTIN